MLTFICLNVFIFPMLYQFQVNELVDYNYNRILSVIHLSYITIRCQEIITVIKDECEILEKNKIWNECSIISLFQQIKLNNYENIL